MYRRTRVFRTLLKGSPQPILEFGHYAFHPLPRVTVPRLQHPHEVVSPTPDSIQVIGVELAPVVIDLFSELLPLQPENVEFLHAASYFWLSFWMATVSRELSQTAEPFRSRPPAIQDPQFSHGPR
jgi:hypothetical protein